MLAIFQAATHGFLGHHVIHREMLADVAKKIEIAHRPVQSSLFTMMAAVSPSKLTKRASCRPIARAFSPNDFQRQELTLRAAAAGVADHSRGAADQHDGPWPAR